MSTVALYLFAVGCQIIFYLFALLLCVESGDYCCMFWVMDTAVVPYVLLLYTASCGNASLYVVYMLPYGLCLWTPLALHGILCNTLGIEFCHLMCYCKYFSDTMDFCTNFN